MAFFKDIFSVFGKYRARLLLVLGIFVAVIAVGGGILKYKTTQSSFCDSCHYMDPFVRHWKSSSHSDVDCVQCHNYGLGALTLSAIRYVTDTYDSRPKADVPDENCLAEGCHDHASLDEGKVFHKNIIFQHSVHLDTLIRGERLRCTSCHNQIVQYESEVTGHMVVNEKACFICHFKDAGVGEAITGCNSCHGMPKTKVEHAGFTFDHKPYIKLGVECKQCHVQVVKGDGSVPEVKCYTCHVERVRDQYSRKELHEIHVTKQGIDCYKCHSDIEHGNFSMVSSLDVQCENCHLRQHNQPKQMYMGIGGKDTLDMPSQMFLAQVSCTGCHTNATPEGEILAKQAKKEASRNSCITCHGKEYENMFDDWLKGTTRALNDYHDFLKSASADFKAAGGSKKSRAAVQAALTRAEENYNFVKEGQMPHNIWYSLYLLNGSAHDFQSAMQGIKKSYKAPVLGAASQKNSCLTFCHTNNRFVSEYVTYDGSELPHQLHITDFDLKCENCHSVTEHGKVQIDKAVCANCH
jgi:nitrate/TMAO reductase-like tetraheme cytochrome c subunit